MWLTDEARQRPPARPQVEADTAAGLMTIRVERHTSRASDAVATFEIALRRQTPLRALTELAVPRAGLGGVPGEMATWVIETARHPGGSFRAIGVWARQWTSARFVAPHGDPVARHLRGNLPVLRFSCRGQTDPLAVLNMLTAPLS